MFCLVSYGYCDPFLLLVKGHDSYISHESYDFMYSLHSEDAPVKTSQKGTKGNTGRVNYTKDWINC